MDLIVYFISNKGVVDYMDPEFEIQLSWDIPILDGYAYKFLTKINKSGKTIKAAREIVSELHHNLYDVLLVHGYMHPVNWVSFLASWGLGIPLMLRGTSTLLDERPTHTEIIKRIGLRILFNKTTACLYLGKCNRQFYRKYGVGEERLFFTPHVVDNEFFSQQAALLRPQRVSLRKNFGIRDNSPVVLFCGKLIPKKQPLKLLQAFVSVREELPCHLLYVGDGPLHEKLKTLVEERDIQDVHFAGFLNQSEISKAYVASDLLVLPSAYGETWGLVINEAMNFELPVIACDKVGASYDLIEENKNGFVVPHDDLKSLTNALRKLVSDRKKRLAFGRKSAEIIRDWNVGVHVDGIVWALHEVLEESSENTL